MPQANDLVVSDVEHTFNDEPSTHQSIRKLMAGNQRYLKSSGNGGGVKEEEGPLRRRLSTVGQSPFAIVISCSDSRCPTERLFDAGPGELFVVRVAGNICASPMGGVIGSTEYGVDYLKSPAIMVLGHTKCGAVTAAVRCCKDCVAPSENFGRNLGAVVSSIRNPAAGAIKFCDDFNQRPETPAIVEHAIEMNVRHTMEQLLKWSPVIRNAVRNATIELHGGIYDIETGEVEFLGKHPQQAALLAQSDIATVRTGLDSPMPANEALTQLKQGNERYVVGNVEGKLVDQKMRSDLLQKGQRPMAIVLGCADSRVALDYVFDTNPGDLFVLRNAGSVCGQMTGGLIGSIEYGVDHLKSQLIVVLGHSKCGAVQAALQFSQTPEKDRPTNVPQGLKCLLSLIEKPVNKAIKQSEGGEKSSDELLDLAIQMNVWHTIEQLIQNSEVIKDAVVQGSLQIQGGVYDLQSGRVNFMGEHPQLNRFILNDDSDSRSTPEMEQANSRTSTMPSLPPNTNRAVVSVVPGDMKKPVAWAEGAEANRDVEAGEEVGSDESEKRASPFELSWWIDFSGYLNTKHGRQHIKDVVLDLNNWRAGVTVALVSVPLSISLGIASGTSPMRGIAAAVFGGLCAGIFGSSDYNIVGPAGALSGMLMSYTVQWGEDVLPWLSLISSAICLVCALLRLDVYMLLMPQSVFEGFTVGVALIIGLNQINFACGLTPDKKHKLFIANIIESLKTLDETKAASLILFLLSTPALWFMMRKFPKIPWTVILPIVSIPLGLLCDHDVLGFELLTLKSKYGILKPELVAPLRTSDATFVDMLVPSFSIAIVAVLETLISAKIAAGRVDRGFDELKELRGLVVSHAVCGVTGAMPPTGVFVRTSLNTSLGATHRFSQVLNAIIVALISLAMMPVFSYLPQATIAAILVVAAIRMTPMKYLMKLWREDKVALSLCLVTALICVGEDPVIGLAAGMVLALLMSAKTMLSSKFVDIECKPSGENFTYNVLVHGALTYVNAETFTNKARHLKQPSQVSLDLSGVRQVDHDGIQALGKVVDGWKTETYIKGVSAQVYPDLAKAAWFLKLESESRVQKCGPCP